MPLDLKDYCNENYLRLACGALDDELTHKKAVFKWLRKVEMGSVRKPFYITDECAKELLSVSSDSRYLGLLTTDEDIIKESVRVIRKKTEVFNKAMDKIRDEFVVPDIYIHNLINWREQYNIIHKKLKDFKSYVLNGEETVYGRCLKLESHKKDIEKMFLELDRIYERLRSGFDIYRKRRWYAEHRTWSHMKNELWDIHFEWEEMLDKKLKLKAYRYKEYTQEKAKKRSCGGMSSYDDEYNIKYRGESMSLNKAYFR